MTDIRTLVRNFVDSKITDLIFYDHIELAADIVSHVDSLKDSYTEVKSIIKELYPAIVLHSECELDSDDGIMTISDETANNIETIIDYNTMKRFQYNNSYKEIGIPLTDTYISKRMEDIICEYVAEQIESGTASYVKIKCPTCGNVNEHYDIPVRVCDYSRLKRIRICPSCWASKIV